MVKFVGLSIKTSKQSIIDITFLKCGLKLLGTLEQHTSCSGQTIKSPKTYLSTCNIFAIVLLTVLSATLNFKARSLLGHANLTLIKVIRSEYSKDNKDFDGQDLTEETIILKMSLVIPV